MAASLAITGIAVSGSAVNLDSDAGDDFIVFGDGNFHTPGQVVWTRKSGGGSTISVGTYGSTPGSFTYNDSPRGVSWTGGTPNATGSGWINGFYDGLNDGGGTTVGGGYTITVPASTTKRRLRWYWGTWGCRVTVSASLSDSSASPVSNTTTIDTPSGGAGYVEIEYEAASVSQTLLVNFFTNRVDQAYGNTTLQAATLKAIGAAGTTFTPAQDAIALTAFAPTLARTANQSVSPAQDAVAITAFAPTLAQTANQAVSPGVDAVAVTGFAPTLQQTNGATFTPAVDSIALTGPAPTITQTANQAVSPGVDSVAITGFAPSIVQASASISLTPAPAALSILGPAPTFAQSGQDPYPLGSGGAPLEYYPSAFEIRDQARRERLDAWAREEQAITRRQQRRPRKQPPQAIDLPRPVFEAPKAEQSKPSPKAAAVAKAAQARRQAESPQAKAERTRIAEQEAAKAQEQAQKAEQERHAKEKRRRNQRRAAELSARFFFG